MLVNDNLAYGIWVLNSPEKLLRESPIIIVGNLTSVDMISMEFSVEITGNYNSVDEIEFGNYSSFTMLENDDGSKTYVIYRNVDLKQYTVDIEEFLKSPTRFVDVINFPIENKTIKVTQTAGSIAPNSITVLPDRLDVGSRALLYIDNWDEQKYYAPESFVLPKLCSGEDMLTKERIWLREFAFFALQNDVKKTENFFSDKPVQLSYTKYMPTITGEKFEVVMEIFNKDDDQIYKTFLKKISNVEATLCEWTSETKLEFNLEPGEYLVTATENNIDGEHVKSNNFYFSVQSNEALDFMSPLKQFKKDHQIDNIQCKESLVIIEKYNGSPACVKPESIPKLIERGWAKQAN